jgi:rRNA maturation endonuclease Nob1
MGVIEETGYCDRCGKQVLGRREGVNHILHALISIFSCGAWVVVWAILTLTTQGAPALCPACGSAVRKVPYRV